MINNSKINLFCVPSAGSSASIFSAWDKTSAENIKVIALEYPGHGRKIQQPLSHDPDFLAHQLSLEILAYGNTPYVLFGHSVGASLIWKIEEKLKLLNADHKLILKIISARPSPLFQNLIHNYGQLSDEQMIKELRLYNNFPDEILNNPNALNFFLNIIKNDFILSDNLLKKPIHKSSVPLMSVYGEEDPYIKDHYIMESWSNYTNNWLGTHQFPGDHFYFLDKTILKEMLHLIQKKIYLLTKTTSV